MNRLELTIEYRGTVFDVRHLGDGERFVVGSDAGVDLPLDQPAFGAHWVLAEMRGGQARLRLPGALEASTWLDGQVCQVAPADGPRGLPLAKGGRALLRAGDVVFYFASVPEAVALPKLSLRDRLGDWRGFGLALVVHATVMLMAAAVPVDASRLELDSWPQRDSWTEAHLRPEVLVQKPPQEPGDSGDGASDGVDAPQADVPPAVAVAPRLPPRSDRPAPSRDVQKARAKTAAAEIGQGIEDALGDSLDAPVLGAMAAGAMNAMNGTVNGQRVGMMGDPFGAFGGGPVGRPGGTPGPSVGITGLDQKGFANVRARQRRGPKGPRPVRRPTLPPVQVIPQEPKFTGSLEKSEIRRVIRKHRAEYRYCYEKALNANHDLNGKIVVKFVISPSGAVSVATVVESTIGDRAVEQCVAGKIKRWVFPQPRDNGLVIVRYPFLFKTS
jgi:TonB family protein